MKKKYKNTPVASWFTGATFNISNIRIKVALVWVLPI